MISRIRSSVVLSVLFVIAATLGATASARADDGVQGSGVTKSAT